MSPSSLTCEEALRRLDDYVDRALSPEEIGRVEGHLEECLRCLGAFRFEAALIEGIQTRLRRLQIPIGLLQRISLRLRAEARKGTFPGGLTF